MEHDRPRLGPRTAFVFTGGGSLGAAQVGMLKALARHRLRPDLVVGVSVGAINAAHFASAPDGAGLPALEALWRRVRRSDVFPTSRWSTVTAFLLRREHLTSPRPLRDLIDRHLPYRRLEEARIPVWVLATDLLSGSSVRLSTGPAVAALMASAAIPGLFPPVSHDGRMLVDGTVGAATPLRAAAELRATRLIVLPAGFPCTLSAPPRRASAMAVHAISLLSARSVAADAEALAHQLEVAVVPPLCPQSTPAWDFSRSGELIDRAEAATLAWIDAGGLDPGTARVSLAPHAH